MRIGMSWSKKHDDKLLHVNELTAVERSAETKSNLNRGVRRLGVGES